MDVKALAAVMVGGSIGAGLRYIVGMLFVQRFGPGVPYGTFVINISGSLLIDIVAELAQTRAGITRMARIFSTTEVLGGFTTFSSFAYESVTLIGEGAAGVSVFYVASSVVVGLTAAYAGMVIARLMAL